MTQVATDGALQVEQLGESPLIVDVPHAGTRILPAMQAQLTDIGRTLPDTDWHVEKLISFAPTLGASILVATHSRYVVDLNRDPTGLALYSGARNTELCPLTTFDDAPIYRPGAQPGAAEVEARRAACWAPYHARLQALIERARSRHGFAIVLDAHSIRARVPRFFEGRLPDLNLGTADGASCAPAVAAAAFEVLRDSGLTHVLNGRFKGGYITRHYGTPSQGVHALQLETAQACYMDERPPYGWSPERAQRLLEVLRLLLGRLARLRL